MSQSSIDKIIRDWFAQARGPGLVLPDGWFGRPFDNHHGLTYLEQTAHKLLLELDSQLLLVFTDLKSVEVRGDELVLSGFAQCVFDWQEYSSMAPRAAVYRSGEVRFWSTPGLARL